MGIGVLICAFNSKYYAYWANNLALSIRQYTNLPITIACDDIAYKSLFDKSLFDKIIRLNVVNQPCEVKLQLDKLTPYENTYFIDSDSLLIDDLPHYEAFFIESQGLGKINKDFPEMLWGNMYDLYTHFELNKDLKIPAVNSSFIFFKKEDFKVFETAYRLYKEKPYCPKRGLQRWGKNYNYPDELYLNVALSILGYDDKLSYETPVYFPINTKGNFYKSITRLKECKKRIITFAGDGGNIYSKSKEDYNRVLNTITKKTGGLYSKIEKMLDNKFMKVQ